MRILLQLLAGCLWPGRSKGPGPDPDPNAYLRVLIVVLIVVGCGPEFFAAVDLIAVLDLLGAVLFVTAFTAGFRAFGLEVLSRAQRIFLPADWSVLIKAPRHPSIVAHRLVLMGVTVQYVFLFYLFALIGVFKFVKAVV